MKGSLSIRCALSSAISLALLLLCVKPGNVLSSSLLDNGMNTNNNNMRQLEDNANDNNSYNTDFDYNTYNMMQSGNCFRTKIISENDDDGNAYFYNGAYRAQFSRYTSFYLCSSSSNRNNNNNCKMFVTDLQTYLQTTVQYVQNYCSACQNTCNNRRRTEENAVTVDCSTCNKQCKSYYEAEASNSNNDALNFLECQESYNDGELQYYSAPQCGNVDLGQYIMIGQFYDNECTIKLNSDDAGSKFGLSYSYDAFETIANIQIDCSKSYDVCYELTSSSIHCDSSSSYDENNEESSKLCRSAQQAGAVYTYYKKPFYAKFHVKALLLVILILVTIFSFLSYTYYTRHQRDKLMMESNNDNTDVDYKLAPSSNNNYDGSMGKASDLPTIN